MGSEAAPPETRPTNVRWVVFSLAFGTSWLLYLHRYSLGVIKPELEKEFSWNNEQLGLLDSAFFLFYTIFQFPCGVLADVFGVRLFLAGMILLWSAMLGLQALVFPGAWWLSPLAVLFCIRALFGLGQAGAYAVLSRITRFWFPLSVRTSVQGWIAVFAGRIGGASSNLLFATVLVGTFLLSWRVSLQLFALAGLLLAVLFWLLFRDSPRQHPWVNEAEASLIEGGGRSATRKLSVRDLFRGMNRRSVLNLLALNLQSFLSTVADFIYVGWIPQFLSQTYNMSAYDRGIYATLPLLGGACGGPLGGYLNDWLIRRTGDRRRARVLVGLAGKGTAAVLLVAGIILCFHDPVAFSVTLFFVKLFGDWSLAGSWGTVTDIGGRATATVFAFNNTVAGVGAVIAPPLLGLLAAKHGWDAVFLAVAATYALCAISWLLIDSTIPLLAEAPAEPVP